MPPFGSWRPDVYDTNTAYAGEAIGVLPRAGSWGPWPSLAALSEALDGPCRGAYLAKTNDGDSVLFAGTATALYKYIGASDPWQDVTRVSGGAYAVSDDERWSFDVFGSKLIATNGIDDVQVIDVLGGSNFTALPGSPPKARYVKTVGDYLFLLSLSTSRGAVAWSGTNDIGTWTRNVKRSDTQEFPDGGFVQGMSALDAGLIIQRDCVRRFGSHPQATWQFARVADSQGTDSPNSIVSHKNVLYYYGIDGFVAAGGDGQTVEIGLEYVDEWFAGNSNQSRLSMIQGALDPTRPRIFWLFPTTGNSSHVLDHIISFDIALKEWSHAAVEASTIIPAASLGYTLDNLDDLGYTMETLPFSLDSRVWQGGAPYLAAFDSAHKLAFFSGSNMAATVQTGQLQLIPGKRAFVNGFRLDGDAEAATGRIATAESQQAAEVWTAASTINAQGFIPCRASSRLHRFEVSVPAGETWQHLRGVTHDEGDVVLDGMR